MQLRIRLVLALGAALFFAARVPAISAAPTPTAAMMKPIEAALSAANTGNPKLMNGLFTSNGIVVDEFAPYTWTGSSAGANWISDFKKMAASQHIENIKGKLQPVTAFNQS